jgi:Flp pilus assembly protein TadB
VSRERARRRAEREAARAHAEAARLRVASRRARRRALLRRFVPPERRRAWLLGRRSAGQRAAAAGVALGLLALVWYLTDAWPTRIGLSLLVLLLMPVLVVVTFGRRV